MIIRLFLAILLSLLFSTPAWAAQSGLMDSAAMQRKMSSTISAQQARPLKIDKPLMLRPTIIRTFTPLHKTQPDKLVKPEGPVIMPSLDLGDSITNSDLLDDLSQACGWNPYMIFQDKAAGHVFYYLPREFLLLRSDNGYGLSVQYNTRAEPGHPSVMLTAQLQAPHRSGDVKLLKAIMREALGLKASDPLELKSLKGIGASADMEALGAGLSLPAERIHLTTPGDFKQSFRLTLSLTQEEVEEVLAQISREGLAGTLHVKIGDDAVPVPIRIRYEHFSGKQIDGFDQWLKNRPTDKIKNLTDFPLQLESINGYRMKGGHLERVAKQLKQTKAIPPGGSRSFKLPAVERILGNNVIVGWLGTSLDTGCTSCLQKIDQQVRKGVALAQGSRIKFEAIPTVFAEFGIYKIIVRIRSPFFVSGGKTVQEQETELTEEANESDELGLFLPGNRGSDALLYRYQLKLVMESGESVQETDWHDSRRLSQFFGSSHLENLLPDSDEGFVE